MALALVGLYGWRITFHPGPFDLFNPRPIVPLSASFTSTEIDQFLSAAMKSEAMTDPLQRCLTFPDPPRSHWSHATVAAYCRLFMEPAISQSDAVDLIRKGHADELDRRLAGLLRAQLSQGNSSGLFESLYELDFYDASAEVRTAIDAWKRQSPASAFAYAASGDAYMRAAQDARGRKFVDETPAGNFEAMNTQLTLARADLDKAVALDPKVTPAYSAMITAGRLGSDVPYALAAAKRGLAVDPANYYIYDYLLTLAEPKWDGSQLAMLEVAVRGFFHAGENPLLLLLVPEAAAYAAGFHGCACRDPVDLTAFTKVFDQVGDINSLRSAGTAASSAKQYSFSVVYLAETLRFDPSRSSARIELINDLTSSFLIPAALAEGNRAVALEPKNPDSYRARGYTYQRTDDFANAEKDYETVLALAPDDDWALSELGIIYVYSTHDWDKGWSAAERLIKSHPENPRGWALRFSIQKDQPRPGLRDTAKYLVDHFSEDPNVQKPIRDAQQILAESSTQH
ncbi:MAG TPA: hypothetical protein VGT79_07935 [Xanthomonadaceae bacterium]|nr:hypothetical protein [Xanthomonadaceae bacterium]